MEEQGLVVVKESYLVRLTKALRRFFFRGKLKQLVESEKISLPDDVKIEFINQDIEIVQEYILDARRAFRKYSINNTKDISNEVFSYILEKINENESKIKKIIEINNDNITFEEILNIIEKEKNSINEFKLRNKEIGSYQVPFGVIGVVCNNVKQSIINILKAISTRNSIIILHNNYNKYSTEALVLLIVQECLKNFYIDYNIVQMFNKDEVELNKLDKVIDDSNNSNNYEYSNIIYMYQEDDSFEEEIINEVNKLKNIEKYNKYEFKVLKGEFGSIINYINKNKPVAVCMYTNNSQKAYKSINWINTANIFINTGLKNEIENLQEVNENNQFYNLKYVLHKDVF